MPLLDVYRAERGAGGHAGKPSAYRFGTKPSSQPSFPKHSGTGEMLPTGEASLLSPVVRYLNESAGFSDYSRSIHLRLVDVFEELAQCNLHVIETSDLLEGPAHEEPTMDAFLFGIEYPLELNTARHVSHTYEAKLVDVSRPAAMGLSASDWDSLLLGESDD